MCPFEDIRNGGIKELGGDPEKPRRPSRMRSQGPLHLPAAFPLGSKSKTGVQAGYGTLLWPPASLPKSMWRIKDGLFPREAAHVSQCWRGKLGDWWGKKASAGAGQAGRAPAREA